MNTRLNDTEEHISDLEDRGSRRRSETEEYWKCIWRNYGWKLPKPKERNKYPGTGSTKGPKQNEANQPITRHTII